MQQLMRISRELCWWKQPIPKGYILCEIIEMENWLVVWWWPGATGVGWGRWRWVCYKRQHEESLCDEDLLHHLDYGSWIHEPAHTVHSWVEFNAHTRGARKTGEVWIISVDCVNVNILIMIFCKILLLGVLLLGKSYTGTLLFLKLHMNLQLCQSQKLNL